MNMLRFFNGAFMCTVLTILAISGCKKSDFDSYYERPDWLAKPIFKQLDSMGNFKNYLVAIEKAGYKETLGTAGSWTVFAPNDEAFAKFLQENNISDINTISKELAEKIVRTSMIYDGENLDRLNDNLSNRGWVEDIAFRRRTVYYDFVEEGKDKNGKAVKYISSNRAPGFPYVTAENNNKHISYFFDKYMSQRNLGASDYNTFFPNVTYTGLNVMDARISETQNNIIAENGVIHVVDKVLMPEKSIDQYLSNNSNYSVFKEILDQFVTYGYNPEISRKYEVLTGNKDSVFVKNYSLIGMSLNNENYMKEDVNDAQINNFSIIVPNNQAVDAYAKKVLLKYYPEGVKLKDLFLNNSEALKEYVNSHIYNTQLWKSNFTSQNNILGEGVKINTNNIIESKLLSNGAFYGVNATNNPDLFHTVYGNLLLDPKFSLMNTFIRLEGYHLTLRIPSLKYMLILIPNDVLYGMGFSYDPYQVNTPVRYNGTDGRVMMRRILQQHIVPLENRANPNLSSVGVLETFNGEYIKYDNGKLFSRGTLDSADVNTRVLKIDSTNVGVVNESGPLNGIAVYVDGVLSYSDKTIGQHLEDYGANTITSPYYKFFNYVKSTSAGLYNTATKGISGVDLGLNYTFLIPTNAAIDAAITAGLLPANANSTDVIDISKIKTFVQYHIIRNSVAVDGLKSGTYETLYKDFDGVIHTVNFTENSPSVLKVRDAKGRITNTILNNSNLFGDRILIHSIDSYLDYRSN